MMPQSGSRTFEDNTSSKAVFLHEIVDSLFFTDHTSETELAILENGKGGGG